MTDFGEPTTPGGALRQAAEEMDFLASCDREQSSLLGGRADALADAARRLRHNADLYDKHQPRSHVGAADTLDESVCPGCGSTDDCGHIS